MENKNLIFWTLGFIAMILALVLVLDKGITNNRVNPTDNGQNSNTEPATSAEVQTKVILDNQAKYPFPESSLSTAASVSSLDGQISPLIIIGADNVQVTKETYTDGKSGFKIVYEFNGNMLSAYQALSGIANHTPFKLLYASRANLGFIVTAESSIYKLKIVGENISSNQTKTTIQIEKK